VSWIYADRKGLIDPGLSRTEVMLGAMRGLAVPFVMLASLVLLPFFSTAFVQASWFLIFPVQTLIRRWVRSRDEPPPGA